MGCASSSTNHVVAKPHMRSARVQDINQSLPSAGNHNINLSGSSPIIEQNHLSSDFDSQTLPISTLALIESSHLPPSSDIKNSSPNKLNKSGTRPEASAFASPASAVASASQSRGDSNYGSDTMTTTSLQVTREALRQFLDLEQQIHELERRRVLDNYLVRTEQLEKLENGLEQLKANKYRCVEDLTSIQNKLGYTDLKSLREIIIQKSSAHNPLNLEEELFLDSMNKKEMIERETEAMNNHLNVLKTEIEQLVKEGERLQLLFAKRDELLDQIFDGQYASDLENQLEKELDWLLEQKHHVDQAYFRWKQAHLSAKQACKQMSEAIKLWKSYVDLPMEDVDARQQAVAETRNLLLSGSQQLQSCQRYLSNIELPYCGQEEVATLEKAISYIFTDMQSEERHGHALSCYQTTFKRCNALKQWLEQVLNMTIARDLYLINEDCKSRTSELRNERIRLIKARIREMGGSANTQSQNSTGYDLRDSGVDSELDESAADEQLARLFDSPSDRKDPANLTPDPTRMPFGILHTQGLGPFNGGLPAGMEAVSHSNSKGRLTTAEESDSPSNVSSLSEPLAPLPSSEQIFGRINELKQRFRAEQEQVRRQQQFSQAKVAQGLKDKLMERRHRRSRAQMHEREAAALTLDTAA